MTRKSFKRLHKQQYKGNYSPGIIKGIKFF